MRAVLFWSYAVQSIVVAAASIYTQTRCTTVFGPSFVHNVPTSTKSIDVPLTAVRKICLTQKEIVTASPVTFNVITTKTSTFTIVTKAPQTKDIVKTLTSMPICKYIVWIFPLTLYRGCYKYTNRHFYHHNHDTRNHVHSLHTNFDCTNPCWLHSDLSRGRIRAEENQTRSSCAARKISNRKAALRGKFS